MKQGIITVQYLVSCTDRAGNQHGATFDLPITDTAISIIRQGWQEAIRLCGTIDKVASAFVSTLEGEVIGTLR